MKRYVVRGRGVVGWPGTDAILFEDGRIAAIGRTEDLGGVQVEAHDGYLSAPRHDHHFHPFGYASAVTRLSLHYAVDFADLGTRLRDAARDVGTGGALIGNRLDDEGLAERRLPTRIELDSMLKEIPVLLHRYCGHAAVANSAALELAGIANHHDGILQEDEIGPVARVVSGRQVPLSNEEVRRALSGLASLGLGTITAIVSAGDPLWCEVPDELETLIEVAPQLPLDFEVLVIAPDATTLRAAAQLLNHSGHNISFLGWKDFADGSLGARTAALSEPYSDDPKNKGVLRLVQSQALEMARACLDLDGVVALHAIGDVANDAVVDLFSALLSEGAAPKQLRIEHASVLTEATRLRIAEMGVTASVQPSFRTSEASWLGKRLGVRVLDTYFLSAMAAAGIHLLGGSDSPVEDPNPWLGMSAAIESGLRPWAAYELYGPRVQVGDPANLVIVDRNPIHHSVGFVQVEAAYRRGRILDLEPAFPFV